MTKKTFELTPPPKAKVRDSRVKEFMLWFIEEYRNQTGCSYLPSWAKDGAAVKRLLGLLDMDALKASARNMLSDTWGRDHATLALLGSHINQWRPKGPSKASTTDAANWEFMRERLGQGK